MPAQILALTCCQVCPTAKVVCNMFVMSVSALLQASPAHACIASVAKSPSTHEKRCRSFEQAQPSVAPHLLGGGPPKPADDMATSSDARFPCPSRGARTCALPVRAPQRRGVSW